MTRIALTAALIAGLPLAATAAPVQWSTADGGNGHYYELITTKKTFADASAAAQASTHAGLSGHIVTITSAEEQAFLDDLNTNQMEAWIGASDTDEEGVFAWITGPEAGTVFYTTTDGAQTYANWNPGEPNDWGSGEDYVEGWFGGAKDWNDIKASNKNAYIVEYSVVAPIPLPAALPLMLLGLGALGYARKRKG
ncbi:lectin-like protein [Dinoroseobacter sp. S124A]|uniref:lectin-like protein n=1 Tax=Dinoroseobacter sp. S124A TaxID=3415128 RepID=UPI003C7B14C5